MTNSVLRRSAPWCCVGCYAHFLFRELHTRDDSAYLHCPVCGSSRVYAIDPKPGYAAWVAPRGTVYH